MLEMVPCNHLTENSEVQGISIDLYVLRYFEIKDKYNTIIT